MKILKKLGITILATGVIYLMIKVATKPVKLPKTNNDPTGKMQVQQDIQDGYEKYMNDRGL